ncbi:unnamed protein product [Adineta steineri]|uniref:NAD(P)(+)--arginine ADP-ribosyltransferase n=1 Tax=Adineta steineri TaxID=433720 RepID=A0A815LJX0_9BILA|nr:unnamed protein product [Adineta steineri]CAF3997440.1 unnamed protein product [Adineta steineri]
MSENRFINQTLSELQEANRSPIFGYEDSLILTLEEAVENLMPLLPDVLAYVTTAKNKCNQHVDLLTWDESAAIYLYSMPPPFHSSLNDTLRAEDRHALIPWFAYLKLFMTALKKLPSVKAVVWRGVDGDVSSAFANRNIDIWWSVNSASMDQKIVQPFLGKHGTLFAIEAMHGKDITQFSSSPEAKEVILMPGTCIRAKTEALNFNSYLFIVHLDEVTPQNESQSESNHLFEWIKQEYRQNGYIERLMNPAKFYPIEESYINLAIVETKKQLCDASNSDAIIGSFEEIYGTKTTIDVKNIFEACKSHDKKVLVFGRAGIGKSTFCRYIAYQWAMGLYWTQYELLVLIPLHRLTTNRYPPLSNGQNYSLLDLVKKEIFSYDLSECEDELLKKHFDAKKTLWILDGYDEIVQNVPSHLECLFKQLLKTPHHILTSRPYQNVVAYHVQMEITGFTDENIERYVQQFFNQMKDELDNSLNKSRKLFKFLKANRSIWGVAHIPVNLELICSLWSNEDFIQTKELKITSLYTVMVEWLCRRYLSMPNKKIQNLSKDDIHQRCEKELAFLENLAFNGMKSNTIILRPNLLRKALNEEKISLHDHPYILNMGVLKSFNKQGIDTRIQMHKDHYFVHLSFQEYFTARYLTKALKQSATHQEEMKFIQREKYNQRYALVFAFLSGLSNETDANTSLNIFWELILTPPVDLLGIRHMQLVISCIEETSSQSAIPQYTVLIESIAKCIEYNLCTEDPLIIHYFAQSLSRAPSVTSNQIIINAFIHLLQNDDSNTRIVVLSIISETNSSNLAVALLKLVTLALDDTNDMARHNACEALGNMGEKAATNEVITKLASALEDKSGWVRSSACEALGKMGKKVAINEVITKLASALEDLSEEIRWSACEALGRMGEKAATNEVITRLATALEDHCEGVRWSACKALRNIGEKAATNKVITKLVGALKDESSSVRDRACEALGRMGEKAATNEVTTKLVLALEDKSEKVRDHACQALKNIGKKAATHEVIPKLVNALGHNNVWVRISACKALGNLGEKAATYELIAKLASALEDDSYSVRNRACQALGNMGEKAATNEVITKLVNALEDKSKSLRASACEALGKMGEKAATNEVIIKLVRALEDKSEEVRSGGYQALAFIGEKASINEVITKFVSALEDESSIVRDRACEALGRMGEKAATNEVITKLATALEDQSSSVRDRACEALGRMGQKAATNAVITKLVSALGDESFSVRDRTCEALGKMGESAATNEVITKLVSVLEGESKSLRASACEALGRMGEKAATNEVITKLVRALEDKSGWVRNGACEALGKIGEKAATNEVITKLVSALEDKSGRVRSGAWQALRNIVKDREIVGKFSLIEYGEIADNVQMRKNPNCEAYCKDLVENRNSIILCFDVELPKMDILPSYEIISFNNPFKFIAKLKLKDLANICNTLFSNQEKKMTHYVKQLHKESDEVKNCIQDPKFSQIVLNLHQSKQFNKLFISQKPFVDIQKRLFESVEISTTKTVYLTRIISSETLTIIKSSSGKFISIGMFILATKSLCTARTIARKMADNGLISILFEIEVVKDARLLEIDLYRVIFRLGAIFRLESIDLAPDGVWYVKIKSADSEFRMIKRQLQFETGVPLSWLTYGNYLYFLKQSRRAKAYFDYLLNNLPLKHIDRSSIYNNMALIYTMENERAEKTKAKKLYDDALKCATSIDSNSKINECIDQTCIGILTTIAPLSETDIDRSIVLGSMADVYYETGDYKLALEHYKQALQLSADSQRCSYYQQMVITVSNCMEQN